MNGRCLLGDGTLACVERPRARVECPRAVAAPAARGPWTPAGAAEREEYEGLTSGTPAAIHSAEASLGVLRANNLACAECGALLRAVPRLFPWSAGAWCDGGDGSRLVCGRPR